MRPELRESLEYNQAYWLSVLTAEDLQKEQAEHKLRDDLGARKYDVFGTANFLNFKPSAAAFAYLLEQGIERIEEHNQRLVSQMIDRLNPEKYDLLSPREGDARSTLVFISHKQPSRNGKIYDAMIQSGVHIAFRSGKLRFSPHRHNTDKDIDHALSVLEFAGS